MKRIHKPACPTANDAVWRSGIMNHSGCMCSDVAIPDGKRCKDHRRDDIGSQRLLGGTLIHNGNCCQSFSVGSLAVPLVKPSFQSLAVTKVCCSTLFAACFAAAMVTAVLLATITAAANPKYRPTTAPSAKPLTKNGFRSVFHSHPKARLDNGRGSCQPNNGRLNNLSLERCCQWTPVAEYDRGLLCSTFRKRLHEDDGVFHACSVDDVEVVNSGGCLNKCVFR